MPDMDFSEVLGAREFQDKFSVQSVNRIIGTGGVESDTLTASKQCTGVVIPGKLSFNRRADGTRFEAFIDIYTKAHLTSGFKKDDAVSRDADIVVWHGRSYVVKSVEDYGAFGSGFYKVSCDLLTLSSPN